MFKTTYPICPKCQKEYKNDDNHKCLVSLREQLRTIHKNAISYRNEFIYNLLKGEPDHETNRT